MKMQNPDQRSDYLRVMGIQSWALRNQPSADTVAYEIKGEVDEINEGETDIVENINIGQLDWAALQALVSSCQQCSLHESRSNTVFGVGDHQAEVMVIGEAPGADEDQQGEPFVGRAGQLLNSMLFAMGFKREQVYIANILKCRPPNNRDPDPNEVSQCESYLKRQIEMINPKVILAVGRIAAQNLLKVDVSIGNMRGKVYRYGETPVIVTYHPAYLLRKLSEKAKSWDDLQLAMSIIKPVEETKEQSKEIEDML